MTVAAMEREFNTRVAGSILATTGALTFLCEGIGSHLSSSMSIAAPMPSPVPFLAVLGGGSLVVGLVLFHLPRWKQN